MGKDRSQPVGKSINLAKALKLKGRLAGKIAALEQTIRTYNSVEDGAERFKTDEALKLHKELKGQLIDLKSRISMANAPIQRIIYELAELKADVTFFAQIPTKQGTYTQPYDDKKTTFVAVVPKQDLDSRTATLQARIDELQDMLDDHNGRTVIEVDENLLTLATSSLPKEWYGSGQTAS